tara:strand:+ start:224 stop:388 length:165 start_codon:yes stop_codon:yes gene_type:complete
MKPKKSHPEKLEDMSNEELLALQDGFLQLLCHANRGIENITKIMHNRFESKVST